MALWTATHDNRWMTTVVENPDGTFAAWAAPPGEIMAVDAVEPAAEAGKAAARDALARKSGHHRCSRRCSPWTLRTYPVFDRRTRPSQQSA